MEGKYIIRDVNTLIEAFIEDVAKDGKVNIALDETLNVKVHLEGEQWQGYIDYKIADFVIKLQEKVLDTYNSVTGENLTKASLSTHENLSIKVTVSEGSTFIEILLDKLSPLINGVESMESKHKMIVLLGAIAIGAAGYTTSTLYDRYATNIEKIADTEKQQYIISKIEEISRNSSAPYINILAQKMKDDDKMTVGNSTYDRRGAISTFRRDTPQDDKSKEISCYVDDNFEILAISFEEGVVKLKQGEKTLKATTKHLSEEDKAALHEIYQIADIAQVIPAADLQVSVTVFDGKIKGQGAVMGLGSKRAGAIPLRQAIIKSQK